MSRKNDRRRLLKDQRYKEGLCVYCGVCAPKSDKKGCEECLRAKYQCQLGCIQNNPRRVKLYRQKTRWDVIQKYGGYCKCCGENNFPFLVIDHKNNDGALERKNTYGSQNGASGSWYLKLKREPVREDLQVLCWNCNAAKQMFGECPHKTGCFAPDFSDLNKDGRRVSHFGLATKIEWPDDESLLVMVNKDSCAVVSRQLGVHDSAVRARLKRRGLYSKVKLLTGKNKRTSHEPEEERSQRKVPQRSIQT